MTDDELIKRLRGRNGFGWTEDAADRIEQLVEDGKGLAQVQESLVETLRESGRKRKEAEAKLSDALDVITRILAIAPNSDDHAGWHELLDEAQDFITKQEKTE